MNNNMGILQKRILELKHTIEDKEHENDTLTLQEKVLRQNIRRYQKIFNKASLSIWEEDPSEAYKIMEALPCTSGKELIEYLEGNHGAAFQLVSNLGIISINDYTLSLFSAGNKTEFYKMLHSGRFLTRNTFPALIKIFAAMMDGNSVCKSETTVTTVDGKELKLLMTAYIPGKGKGNIIISMIDISERIRREDDLAITIDQAEKQKKSIEVLQNILLSLTSTLDREKILTSILLEAGKIIPHTSANIRLIENGYLKVIVANGYEKYNAGNYIRNSSVKIEEFGDTKIFLTSGEINIIPDTKNYSGWTTYPETSYIRGYIGIPIKLNNQVIGLLSLESDKTNTFKEADKAKLEPFANAAALALQSSFLMDLTKEELSRHIKTEASIKKSLTEKEILLKEIHHRVKNNLSLIISLINLQDNMLPGDINPIIFENLKQRIYTISLVHEKLYNSNNLSDVNLKSYIIDLVHFIESSSQMMEGIKIWIDIENDIEIQSDTLIPLGLLVNELVNNSIKHAFIDKHGTISIIAKKEKEKYKIIVKDTGIGLLENKRKSDFHSGLILVESLTAQMGGKINFQNEGGSVSTLILPQKKLK